MQTNAQNIPGDALTALLTPDPSPTLTVLRSLTEEDGDKFTLEHKPMSCPALPPAPEKVRAGKRAHSIRTLTDLRRYVQRVASEGSSPVAFYTERSVSVCLDENQPTEHEVVTCSLDRHPEFEQWNAVLGNQMNQVALMEFLRLYGEPIDRADPSAREYLIGSYASLRGELTHDADEYLDMQSRSATFHVKRKGRGQQQAQEVEAQVPTQFRVQLPILLDDEAPIEMLVIVSMRGGAGAEIIFTLNVPDLAQKVDAHIRGRLATFAESAGFDCVQGEYRTASWAEPQLPASVKTLLEQQTEMLRAMRGNTRI